MEKKTVSAIMLTLLLMSMLTLAFNIQPAKAASETIIDTHGDSRFTKYPSGPYWWSVEDHDAFHTRAYNNNFWYTYCGEEGQGELYFGTWYQSLTQSSVYEVFVWIPNPDPFGTYTPTQNARYQIYHKDGMTERTVNQRLRIGGWYSVGKYTFDTSLFVILNDRTGEPYLSTMIAFDAIKFVEITPINQPFTLSSGYVSPSSGDTSTTFSYYVTYSDPEGDLPTLKYVYIDYSPHTMVKISGDYVPGAVFRYSTTLSVGLDHNYYFYFEDSVHSHTKSLPPSGTYPGPNVPPPDFSITSSPTTLTIQKGNSGTSTITVTSLNGFNQPVQLTKSGVPAEVTATLSPSQVTPPAGGTATSTLTVSVSTTATPGNYPITVTGTSGALVHSAYISLEVIPSSPPPTFLLTVFTLYGGSTDPPSGSYRYDEGTVVTVKAMADSGWEFEYWELDGSIMGNANPLSVTMDRDHFLVANFRIAIATQIPVLLVHGFEIFSGYDPVNGGVFSPGWRAMAEYLTNNDISNVHLVEGHNFWKLAGKSNEDFTVYISNYASCQSQTLPIRYYSQILATEIEAIKEDAKVNEINVVAHSLGGLIVRAYIENEDFGDNPYGTEYKGDIAKLVMLGTPNNGEAVPELLKNINEAQEKIEFNPLMASVLAAFEDFKSALARETFADVDSDSEFIAHLNAGDTWETLGVEYWSVAGDFCDNANPLAYLLKLPQLLLGYGDGLVHVESALYGVPSDRTKVFPLTHKELLTSASSREKVREILLGQPSKGDWFILRYCSPIEPRIYDSEGRITGLVDGQVVQDIPNSTFDQENEIITIYPSIDPYHCEVVGTEEGVYMLITAFLQTNSTTTFTADNIPTTFGSGNIYLFNWAALSNGEEGVTVEVDSDGNGVPEYTFTSDSELTQSEFLTQTGQSALGFSIVWGEETFIVSVESNSTVGNFAFNQPNKAIIFHVSGSANTTGFCNVTIPKALLYADPGPDWIVLIDGALVPPAITENATHTSLYFTYTHSTRTVQVIGTWVIGPPPPPTYSLTITTTVGGTTDPTPGTYSHAANSTVQVTAIPEANYLFDHWEIDTVNVGSANSYTVLMDSNHTLKAVFTYSPPPPPLSASISPLSASILIGQSVTFTSTVSGGYTPYSYQWYLNGNPVSGATSNTWTFTPTTSGIYYIHLKVTDAKDNTAQSETSRITAGPVPVGGYSISIERPATAQPVLPYIALIATLTAILTKLRPKTKRKR